MRSYWEENIHVLLESFGDGAVLYKARAENNISSKTQNLDPNLLLPCDILLDNFNWNILEEENSESTSIANKLAKDRKKNSIKKLLKEGQHSIKKEKPFDNEGSSNESSEEELLELAPEEFKGLEIPHETTIGERSSRIKNCP